MSPGNEMTRLPDFVLVQRQASQLHQDLQAVMATGMAKTSPLEPATWLREAYDDLAARARKILQGPQLPHLDKARNIADVYMALGQLVATLTASIDQAARRRSVPMGFRPPEEKTSR